MQNTAEGEEEDIKVLPEEGLSVGIGGETYNPAFPRFSCQIIIFLSDYDWEQIVLERRHLKPTEFSSDTFVADGNVLHTHCIDFIPDKCQKSQIAKLSKAC